LHIETRPYIISRNWKSFPKSSRGGQDLLQHCSTPDLLNFDWCSYH